MQYCVIIKGPSAVGKTAITRKLVKNLSEHEEVAVIPGDYLAHLVERCRFTEDQLDLKYENMLSLMINLFRKGYSIIINDLFRRVKDLQAVLAEAKKYTSFVLVVELTAPLEILQQRNRSRDALDYQTEGRIKESQKISKSVSCPEEVVIDTTKNTPKETVASIIQLLKQYVKT